MESGIRIELDIIVTAIVKHRGEKIFNPAPDEKIKAGDVLIAMGRAASLDGLARVVGEVPAHAGRESRV